MAVCRVLKVFTYSSRVTNLGYGINKVDDYRNTSTYSSMLETAVLVEIGALCIKYDVPDEIDNLNTVSIEVLLVQGVTFISSCAMRPAGWWTQCDQSRLVEGSPRSNDMASSCQKSSCSWPGVWSCFCSDMNSLSRGNQQKEMPLW